MIDVTKVATAAGGTGSAGEAMGPGMMGSGFAWPMIVFAMVMMVLLLVLAVGGVVALLRYRRGPGRGQADPLAILATRYARGEIDAEEYEARRARLAGRGD